MNERLQAIHNAIQFVEGNLHEPITVADIAEAAGYSLYHFIRTFNQTVQHTPYDYLMRRRLSEAACALLENEHRIIDIALEFQFNNHETFTRAFSRTYKMSPTQWREQGLPDHRLLLPRFDRDDLEYLSSPEFEKPKLVILDEIILAGLMAPLNADQELLPSLWRNLKAVLQRSAINPEPSDYWGIRTQLSNSECSSYYFAGVIIPSLTSAPSAFVTKIIPAGDYVSLPQKKTPANIQLSLKYLYHAFLPGSGFSLTDPLVIEQFGVLREIFIPVQKE